MMNNATTNSLENNIRIELMARGTLGNYGLREIKGDAAQFDVEGRGW